DERDIPCKAALAQALRGLSACLAGADDDDAFDFARTHSGLVFAAAGVRAQAGLDAWAGSGQHPAPWQPKPLLIRGKLRWATRKRRLRWGPASARGSQPAMLCV